MMYENARFRAFSKKTLSLVRILLPFARRTDTIKQNVVPVEIKAMGIPNALFQSTDKIHVHIEEAAANTAFYVAVVRADMVEAVGTPGQFKAADLPHLG